MSREALKQSLITEAAIQSKDHPSKDARTFAKSVHEYLMAEQPAQRKPLTDEEWQSIADTLGCFITRGQKDAIEAALGIKENT